MCSACSLFECSLFIGEMSIVNAMPGKVVPLGPICLKKYFWVLCLLNSDFAFAQSNSVLFLSVSFPALEPALTIFRSLSSFWSAEEDCKCPSLICYRVGKFPTLFFGGLENVRQIFVRLKL